MIPNDVANIFSTEVLKELVIKYGTPESVKRAWETRHANGENAKEEEKAPKKFNNIVENPTQYVTSNIPKDIERVTMIDAFADIDNNAAGQFSRNALGTPKIELNRRCTQNFKSIVASIEHSYSKDYTVTNKILFSTPNATRQNAFIKSTLDHEMGHLKLGIYAGAKAVIENYGYDPKKDHEKILSKVQDYFKSGDSFVDLVNGDSEWKHILFHEVSENGFKISDYMLTSDAEAFAECHTAYQNGLKLPTSIKNYIKKVDKYLEEL